MHDEVAVVGSVNLDLVASSPRIPRPGETVLSTALTYRNGGKGANQAVAAHRAGARALFFGAVGSDEFGRRILTDLAEAGLSTEDVHAIDGESSGMAMIVVDVHAENTITVSPGANHSVTPSLIGPRLKDALGHARVLVLQGEIPLETVLYAAQVARQAGVRVIFNASPLSAGDEHLVRQILQVTDILIVNETEARLLGGEGASPEALARSVQRIGGSETVVTLGGAGAILADSSGTFHIPAFKVDPVDATGAGDAFCGTLAAEIAFGTSTPHAIRIANAAGALATTVLGAQAAASTRAQIEKLLEEGAFDNATF